MGELASLISEKKGALCVYTQRPCFWDETAARLNKFCISLDLRGRNIYDYNNKNKAAR